MIAIRRKTRETLRHNRAVVVQQATTPTVDQQRADQEAEKRKGDELRRKALRRIK